MRYTLPRLFVVLALVASFLSPTVRADTLEGLVVSIADGDTLTVLDDANTQHRIRLTGIDAPEKRQPFGTVSRQHLADAVFQRRVVVDYAKSDRYGRLLGKVLLDGQDQNLAQLSAGLAWHYKQYEREQEPSERQIYALAEDEAKPHGRAYGATLIPCRRGTGGILLAQSGNTRVRMS